LPTGFWCIDALPKLLVAILTTTDLTRGTLATTGIATTAPTSNANRNQTIGNFSETLGAFRIEITGVIDASTPA